MVWKTLIKDLSITNTTGHQSSQPGVSGQAPTLTGIQFTPLELFGAAARCSHTSFVNPAVSTPESHMIAALVEQYVDDVSPDFAILPTATHFKDFVKSYFSGTVAAGLAYLAMIRQGYQWVDHFENVVGGNPTATRSPDFVFSGTTPGNALLESKGTRQAGRSTFDSTIEAGYLGQVEPHLGHSLNGVFSTHGYCIGSWLTSTTKAEMMIHHTAVTQQGAAGGNPPGQIRVQQHNYATAFQLTQSLELSRQLRRGAIEEVPPMFRLYWLSRTWVTSFPGLDPWYWDFPLARQVLDLYEIDRFYPHWPAFAGFALEERIASTVISRFYRAEGYDERPLEIEPLPADLGKAATVLGEGEYGAVFPDGLAVLGRRGRIKEIELVRWARDHFEPG